MNNENKSLTTILANAGNDWAGSIGLYQTWLLERQKQDMINAPLWGVLFARPRTWLGISASPICGPIFCGSAYKAYAKTAEETSEAATDVDISAKGEVTVISKSENEVRKTPSVSSLKVAGWTTLGLMALGVLGSLIAAAGSSEEA